jgi:hypothetical protein
MSLINEALKKAQRVRADDASHSAAGAHTSGGARRGNGHGANTMVLLGTAGLVLVVLSVVFTVYLVNRPSTPTTLVAGTRTPAPEKAAPAAANLEPSTPLIVAPKIIPTVPTPAATETSVAVPAVSSAPLPNATAAGSPTPEKISSAPPAVAPATAVAVAPAASAPAGAVTPTPPPLAAGEPDERVATFVDAIRITGIRSLGAESRVLMNERVYRVNDIVERTLGVRLIQAAADRLTFSDARGVVYEKKL